MKSEKIIGMNGVVISCNAFMISANRHVSAFHSKVILI